MYDTTLGRFLRRDPLGLVTGDANLYAYVRDSPLNATDPYGLIPEFFIPPKREPKPEPPPCVCVDVLKRMLQRAERIRNQADRLKGLILLDEITGGQNAEKDKLKERVETLGQKAGSLAARLRLAIVGLEGGLTMCDIFRAAQYERALQEVEEEASVAEKAVIPPLPGPKFEPPKGMLPKEPKIPAFPPPPGFGPPKKD